jgi:hypothetical protein
MLLRAYAAHIAWSKKVDVEPIHPYRCLELGREEDRIVGVLRRLVHIRLLREEGCTLPPSI